MSGAGAHSTIRYELSSPGQRIALAAAALPGGMRAGEAVRSAHRDLYLDTTDGALRRRGVVCRLRVTDAGRQLLHLRIPDGDAGVLRFDARVRSADAVTALAEDSVVARRLRAIVDPRRLASVLHLEVARLTRAALPDVFRRPRLLLHYDEVTVRHAARTHVYHGLCVHATRRVTPRLHQLAQALEHEHGLCRAPDDQQEHARLMLRWLPGDASAKLSASDQAHRILPSHASPVADMLNPELSLLAFQRRVLSLAEDERTPLRERFRFIGIVTSNLDELYMVRMAELRRAARREDEEGEMAAADDGTTAAERLERVEGEVAAILALQWQCASACLRRAADAGVHVLSWAQLDPADRDALSRDCRDQIHPALTPLAMTLSPGHPLPHLPHLGLSLAVVVRRTADGEPHLAEIELPGDAERWLPVPGHPGGMITLEEVLKANLDLLHPHDLVEGAHLFRVTRGGDLALDEDASADLLETVSQATERRPLNPAVRVEVEGSMPMMVRHLVLENLRREALALGTDEPVDRVQVMDGLLDLRCLARLPLPIGAGLQYPPLEARAPIAGSMFEAISAGEILRHHPFDAFDASVVRFLSEAADDPDVTTIKITLYRVGDPSPVVDALLRAAASGKRVVAIVELKARFDEEHNVAWARTLERAGGHVVYGLVGLKVHAKAALVVRREGSRLRRYVHVGTGNYSARSGREYTDLSLFSARPALGDDIADLFNELTGSARPPQGLAHGALVAPHQLLPALLARIERETAHASEGRMAAIAIKVNGLSDPEIVRALYRAAQAGVRVELVVRGICTLRPGVAGLSPGIRVVSVVGRFLEHSRIYRFANAGDPVYLLGSSDLRPRNLRRRVELLVPVLDPAHRAELDAVLAQYLADRTAWSLASDGSYRHAGGGAPGAQEVLATPA